MTVAAVLLGASVLLSLAFVVVLGRPGRHADPAMAWFLASTGWAAVALDVLLLVSVLGARVPMWAGLGALIVQDAVFGWRLWLVLRSKRRS